MHVGTVLDILGAGVATTHIITAPTCMPHFKPLTRIDVERDRKKSVVKCLEVNDST